MPSLRGAPHVTVWVTSPKCPSSIERVSWSNVTPVGLGGTGTGVGSGVGWGVADGLGLAGVAAAVGLAAAGVMVIDGDAVGVTSGAVVEADVQAAAMSRPTLIVVASRTCDKCIPCPSTVYQWRRSGAPAVAVMNLTPCRLAADRTSSPPRLQGA
jgi:hypothetical protein